MLLLVTKSHAQSDLNERHIMVSMRMIGHEILLDSGDSTSLVLPIEKENTRYKIQFESEFQFEPTELVATINKIVKKTKIASSYIVEIENCETNEVIYDYEIGNIKKLDIIPCRQRNQPKACYNLYFTILVVNHPVESLLLVKPKSSYGFSSTNTKINYYLILLMLIILLSLIGFANYFWKKKSISDKDTNLIAIGIYQFDRRNMTLSYEHLITELTSKESDLLLLLHSSENKVLERENILNVVWGDDGDYIGRTLDVFISKLRKKLSRDPNLKIVNIRGIGYKFVMNNQN